MNLSYDSTNVLDYYADFKMPLPNIQKSILGDYINCDYIDYVNTNRSSYNAKVVLLPIQKLLKQRQCIGDTNINLDTYFKDYS